MSETGLTVALGGGPAPPRERIGNKAHSLARMAELGLRVPPAFVVTTEACRAYFEGGERLPPGLMDDVRARVAELEARTGRTFGRGQTPLLLSVRSGAPVSMPGMMDTVLNLGLCPEVQAALVRENPAFAGDTQQRFEEMYRRIVLKDAPGPIPADPFEALERAIGAVFASFHSRRAKRYREHAGISHDLGTAVAVQAMVFGNLDDRSGTGVLFSRNPLTGDREPYGEYLPRAQGEDVVSGTRQPLPLTALAAQLPEVHRELLAAARALEADARDVQDVEFTVQSGTLYFLQTRNAKRAPRAAVRLAVAFASESHVPPEAALRRVTSDQVRTLLRPRLDAADAAGAVVLARGEPAGPGVGQGVVVTDPDVAERAEEPVVLARATTSPEDVHGMLAAEAVVTETGGATCHAAVVSRALGRPCVVGCGAVLGALEGRMVTVDGDRGVVYQGRLTLHQPSEAEADLATLTTWAEARSPLTVQTGEGDAFVLPDDAVELEPAALTALLRGHTAARGAVLESHAGIAAAVRAGVRTVFVKRRLPALLSALEAMETP